MSIIPLPGHLVFTIDDMKYGAIIRIVEYTILCVRGWCTFFYKNV